MAFIFHITPRDLWEAAGAVGEYRAPSLDSEGFVHCSTSDQLIPVANSFYHGQHGLVLLCIDTDQLEAECRYEAATDPVPGTVGQEFPHIYGPVNLNAVLEVVNFEPGPDGRFLIPGRTMHFR